MRDMIYSCGWRDGFTCAMWPFILGFRAAQSMGLDPSCVWRVTRSCVWRDHSYRSSALPNQWGSTPKEWRDWFVRVTWPFLCVTRPLIQEFSGIKSAGPDSARVTWPFMWVTWPLMCVPWPFVQEFSAAKSAGLDPERVLEIFKTMHKDGSLGVHLYLKYVAGSYAAYLLWHVSFLRHGLFVWHYSFVWHVSFVWNDSTRFIRTSL